MKKYSEKGWNWLIDHYPHEPGRYWFEGFNPVEGYPNKPDLTRKNIHVLADVDDITHPLDATAVTNGEPLYNLFFFATLPGADNLVRFKRFDEEADLRRVGIKMCAKSIDEFTKGFRLFANASRQQGLFDLGVDLLTNPELIKRPDFRYSKIAYDFVQCHLWRKVLLVCRIDGVECGRYRLVLPPGFDTYEEVQKQLKGQI